MSGARRVQTRRHSPAVPPEGSRPLTSFPLSLSIPPPPPPRRSAGLHRRQRGHGDVPGGTRRRNQPARQRGLDPAARRRLLRIHGHRRVSQREPVVTKYFICIRASIRTHTRSLKVLDTPIFHFHNSYSLKAPKLRLNRYEIPKETIKVICCSYI